MSRYLLCGSRKWNDPILDMFVAGLAYWQKLQREKYTIITGGARGTDRRAATVAQDVGVTVEEYPADWDKHPKAAGPIRNQRMLDEGRPKIVLSFGWGPGTRDMCRRAIKAGLPVYNIRRLTEKDVE